MGGDEGRMLTRRRVDGQQAREGVECDVEAMGRVYLGDQVAVGECGRRAEAPAPAVRRHQGFERLEARVDPATGPGVDGGLVGPELLAQRLADAQIVDRMDIA